ncbi:MAG: SurA N-terminal domain-containing protein [Rickettsiales bacterium]
MMQRISRSVAALILGFCLTTIAHAAQVNIAAVVDDNVITTTDISERRDLIMATAGIPNTVENQQKITPRVVQALIDETLQMQEAKRQSLVVSDADLNKALDAMGTRGDSGETIRDFIRKNGLSQRSLENQIRAQLAWGKVVQRKLRRNVTIAQDEVLRAQKAASTAPGDEEYRVQAIEIAINGKPDNAAKLAQDIALQLKAGTEMPSIATRYIKQPELRYSAPVWVPEKNLPPVLQQAMRTLKTNEVTPPLRSDTLIQIIQLLDRKTSPKLADTTEYAIKQLAIEVPKQRDKGSLAKLTAVAASLQANPGDCMSETIPKVDLPVEVKFARARLGTMSPQQRSLVSHLEVGDISDPLMGPDALRLIMVCEKTEASSGSLPDAETIRQQLFADKMELEAQKHLRNLRRDAFIDIKGAN